MQQLLFLLRQPGLVLLMGLTGGFGLASARRVQFDINLTASIVNSTCKLSLENGGSLPSQRHAGMVLQ